MTRKGLADFILYKLKITATSDFSDSTLGGAADMLGVVNNKLFYLCQQINKAKTDLLGTYAHENLVADQREYPLPPDVLNNLKAIFLKLDGTNYTRATIVDLNDPVIFENVSRKVIFQEAWITAHFNNSEPYIVLFRNSIFIFSGAISAVTNGIQLWYINLLAPLLDLTDNTTDLVTATDTTVTPNQGLPKQFHEPLARLVIKDWKITNSIDLNEEDLRLDKDIKDAVDQLKGQSLEQEIIMAIPSDTGSSY